MFNKFTNRSKKSSTSSSSKFLTTNEENTENKNITPISISISTPQPQSQSQSQSQPKQTIDHQTKETTTTTESESDPSSAVTLINHHELSLNPSSSVIITPQQHELHSPNTSFFNLNNNNNTTTTTPKSIKTLNINPNFNSSKTSISSKSIINHHHHQQEEEESKQSTNLQKLIQDSIDQESNESSLSHSSNHQPNNNNNNNNIETTPTLNNTNPINSRLPSSSAHPSTLLAPLPLSTSTTPTPSPSSANHHHNPIPTRKPNKKPSKSSSITSTNSVLGTGGIAEALAMSGVALVNQANHLPSPPSIRRTSNPISSNPTNHSNVNLSSNDTQLLNALPPSSASSNGIRSPHSTLHHQPSNYDLASEFEDQYLGTGYAVASRKRNFDFHSIFKAVPQDDYLIEDYGCALQRDILVQGRLYISEQHLCFNANIFGWVTTLVLPFSDVVSIEKKMTALIIPNAIQVMTMQSRHTFASFISRDVTYDLMTNIWRISHPTIPTHNNLSNISLNPAIGNDEVHVEYLGPSSTDPNTSNPESNDPVNPSTTAISKVPESSTCACLGTDAHYKDVALDMVYRTTLENLYNLLFMNSDFMISFWQNDQHVTELETSEWTNNTKKISYIKPLNASMGPKQCKCELSLQIIGLDFMDSITILTTTRTPDVPAGSSFSVLTRTCLMFVPEGVRIVVTTAVEWSKVNRFLKSIIESSALSGQKAYHSDLDQAIRQEIKRQESSKATTSTTTNGPIHEKGGGGSGRKEGNEGKGSLNENNVQSPIRSLQPTSTKIPNLSNNPQPSSQSNKFMAKNLNITSYLGISILMILLISNLLTFRNSYYSFGGAGGNEERMISRDEIKQAIREGIQEWVSDAKKRHDQLREIEGVLDRFEDRIRVLRGIGLGEWSGDGGGLKEVHVVDVKGDGIQEEKEKEKEKGVGKMDLVEN